MAKKSRRVSKSVQEPREAEVVETRVRRRDEAESSDSSSLVRNVIIAVLILLGLILLFNVISGDDSQENGDQALGEETSQVEGSVDEDNAEENEVESEGAASNGQSAGTQINETDDAYEFTVGDGESYTTMARRAVASVNNELTPAERIAAETKLVQDAGAGWLNAGQDLTLSKDTVRAAIDWAKGLSAEQKAAWQPYADLVAW